MPIWKFNMWQWGLKSVQKDGLLVHISVNKINSKFSSLNDNDHLFYFVGLVGQEFWQNITEKVCLPIMHDV